MTASSVMGGELRRWRYFVVVAEELHMTRAAERLFIAQPSLSQQIRRLESDLGVSLFERGARGLQLTAAGEVFAQDAAQALAVVDSAVHHVRDLGRGLRGTLRVGFISTAAAELTPTIVRSFKEKFPEINLQLRQFQLDDPFAGLMRDLTDVSIVIPPLASSKVTMHTLFRQPRVALLPAGHRFAKAESPSIDELFDEVFVRTNGYMPDEWLKFWLGDDHRGGRSARFGAEYSTIDEKYEHVGLGSGICLLPSSSARYYSRPGVIHLDVPQLEPCDIALAKRKDCRDEKVDAFIANSLLVSSSRAMNDIPEGQVVWAPSPTDL